MAQALAASCYCSSPCRLWLVPAPSVHTALWFLSPKPPLRLPKPNSLPLFPLTSPPLKQTHSALENFQGTLSPIFGGGGTSSKHSGSGSGRPSPFWGLSQSLHLSPLRLLLLCTDSKGKLGATVVLRPCGGCSGGMGDFPGLTPASLPHCGQSSVTQALPPPTQSSPFLQPHPATDCPPTPLSPALQGSPSQAPSSRSCPGQWAGRGPALEQPWGPQRLPSLLRLPAAALAWSPGPLRGG